MEKRLKYITMRYFPETKELMIEGHNKYVEGQITISYLYLYSIFCFIARIFRRRRWKEVKHDR